MKNISKNEIVEALSKINDISRGSDIYSAGIVSNIALKENNVQITLEVESYRANGFERIRQEAENAINAIANVSSCTVVLTSHSKVSNKIPSNNFQKILSEDKKTIVHESNVKVFIALASGKGGVGKSTTAVNLAVSLGLEGFSVGLLDADVYGPSQPRMLGISGRPKALPGDMVAPMKNHGISMMSMGLLVPDDTAMIWRGPMVQSALTQMLNNVVWGELDVMIVDLPPGTGDIQISLAQQVKLSGAVIVSTPQDIALLDVVKAMTMFEKANVKVSGMIQNMSFWECPDCGRVDHVFGQDGVSKEALRKGLPLLGEIPLDINIRKGSDSGTPIVISNPLSKHAKAYRSIAKSLIKIHGIGKEINKKRIGE